MKTKAKRTGSDAQTLINEIQSARFRLTRAESKWELAEEQARAAKRRRKEAKALARRARKQARLAGEELTEAKEALVVAEEKFDERTALDRKLARARLAAKSARTRKVPRAAHAKRSPAPVALRARLATAKSSPPARPVKPRRRSTPVSAQARPQRAAAPQPALVRTTRTATAIAPVIHRQPLPVDPANSPAPALPVTELQSVRDAISRLDQGGVAPA